MGPASEFSWCGLSKQKISMKIKDKKDSPKYCKQFTDWDFNIQKGKVRIDLEAFANCTETSNDLDSESFQCVDWDDIEMTISLFLDQCHLYMLMKPFDTILDGVYNSTCRTHKEACSWEKYEEFFEGINYEVVPWHYGCIKKNTSFIPSAVINFNHMKPLNAEKATGTISTKEEEDTDMILLHDSEDNLECLTKEFEIQSLGKD